MGEDEDDAALRQAVWRAAPVRGLLQQVAAQVSGGSYREAACFADVHRSGTELDVHGAGETARMRLLPTRRGYRVEIVAERPAGPSPPPSTLVRLARWIRERRGALDTAESDRAWASGVTEPDDIHDVRVDRAGTAISLEIELRRPPTASQLVRWLDATRQRIEPS